MFKTAWKCCNLLEFADDAEANPVPCSARTIATVTTLNELCCEWASKEEPASADNGTIS